MFATLVLFLTLLYIICIKGICDILVLKMHIWFAVKPWASGLLIDQYGIGLVFPCETLGYLFVANIFCQTTHNSIIKKSFFYWSIWCRPGLPLRDPIILVNTTCLSHTISTSILTRNYTQLHHGDYTICMFFSIHN